MKRSLIHSLRLFIAVGGSISVTRLRRSGRPAAHLPHHRNWAGQIVAVDQRQLESQRRRDLRHQKISFATHWTILVPDTTRPRYAWKRYAAPRSTPAKTPWQRKSSSRDSMPEQPPPKSSGRPDALAWFDVGYLAETFKQWIGQNLPHMTDGMRMDANPAAGVDGYALVKKALALRGRRSPRATDPQMEFAAALITLSGPAAEHREHAQKAIIGAKTDSLLAQNLATRFLGPKNRNHVSTAGQETNLTY